MPPACRRTPIASVLAAAIALVPARPVRAQLTATLSPQDVRAAIAWGNSGEPAPYQFITARPIQRKRIR